MSTPLYRWYTHRLVSEVNSRPMPQHVALILDGNRRFARQIGLGDVTEGHRFGVEKVRFQKLKELNHLGDIKAQHEQLLGVRDAKE